jgi:hypothetical protein
LNKASAGKEKRMADHTVTITESGGVFVVDMRKLHTKEGKTVTFHNDTDDPMAIFFPERDLFSELKEQYTVVEVPARATSSAYTIKGAKQGAKTDNHYAYAVYCHTTGEFAVANSNPEIIIDW